MTRIAALPSGDRAPIVPRWLMEDVNRQRGADRRRSVACGGAERALVAHAGRFRDLAGGGL
jgi:hypothetical protein